MNTGIFFSHPVKCMVLIHLATVAKDHKTEEARITEEKKSVEREGCAHILYC